MLEKKQITAIIFSQLLASSAFGNLGLSFGSGEGILDISPYRLGMSWDFGSIWRERHDWGLHAIWESSAGYWAGRNDYGSDTPSRLNVVTSGPMFRWQMQTEMLPFRMLPYLELGVAASWLSETEIGGRKLSLHFQFEDKVGAGVRFGKKKQYDMSIRGVHYSNASLKRPNSGVNLLMFTVGMWFGE